MLFGILQPHVMINWHFMEISAKNNCVSHNWNDIRVSSLNNELSFLVNYPFKTDTLGWHLDPFITKNRGDRYLLRDGIAHFVLKRSREIFNRNDREGQVIKECKTGVWASGPAPGAGHAYSAQAQTFRSHSITVQEKKADLQVLITPTTWRSGEGTLRENRERCM